MLEVLKGHIKLGCFYILAPENPSAFKTLESVEDFEQVFQYGSDEVKHPKSTQDRIAPQAPIPCLKNVPDENINYGRVYIPIHDPQVKTGPIDSHLIKNYGWIFGEALKGIKGEVQQR